MRNNIIGLMGLALTGLFLTGCASTKQMLPRVADGKPPADKALMVVEGTESWAGMAKLYSYPVFDNGILVGKVAPHEKLIWLRNPGPMELKLNPRAAGRYVTVVAGERYQFKVDCNSTYRKGLVFTFSGPGAPINQLSKEDAVRIKQEVESALGAGKRVRRMEIYASLFSITLDVPAANEENDCRKVMQVFAHDPMIPYHDNVAVMSAHDSALKKTGAVISSLLTGGIIGGSLYAVEEYSDDPSTENVTYACIITRDALMKGGEPKSWK